MQLGRDAVLMIQHRRDQEDSDPTLGLALSLRCFHTPTAERERERLEGGDSRRGRGGHLDESFFNLWRSNDSKHVRALQTLYSSQGFNDLWNVLNFLVATEVSDDQSSRVELQTRLRFDSQMLCHFDCQLDWNGVMLVR
jgi:hypothetical protein